MNNLPDLKPISLDISQIEYQCYHWYIPETRRTAGLIKFRGVYRRGSAGTPDATFIQWRLDEFGKLEDPMPIWGLVVDFRELDYVWGDDFCPGVNLLLDGPVRMVIPSAETHPEQYKAFRWALGQSEKVCTDIELAFAEIREILLKQDYR